MYPSPPVVELIEKTKVAYQRQNIRTENPRQKPIASQTNKNINGKPSDGNEREKSEKYKQTLGIRRLPQQDTGLLPKHHGTIDSGNRGDTMTKISLKFVHIIDPLATPTSMLAVYGVHS